MFTVKISLNFFITFISVCCIIHLHIIIQLRCQSYYKFFLRTLWDLPFKCCYNNIILPCGHSSLETNSGHSETTSQFITRHSNEFPKANAGQLPEVTAIAGGCSDCWKQRRVASDACNMTKNDLSILIDIFPHNPNKLRPHTESYLFSGPTGGGGIWTLGVVLPSPTPPTPH